MRYLERLLTIASIALVLVAAPVVARAETADPEAYGDGYQRGDFGRVRHLDPSATIIHADEEVGTEKASLNDPVLPADAVVTGEDERAEIQLANGTLVRIDEISDLVFTSLPDPTARYQDNVVLQLRSGVIRVQARIGSKDEFRIDTPAASVHLLGDGDYRIEVGRDGRTRVVSRRGVAEVVGQDASVLVRGGTRTEARPGAVPEDPRPYNTFAEDRFDEWVDARERTLREAKAKQDDDGYDAEDVPEQVRPYYGELSSYGNWVWIPEYGYAWYPVGTAPGWRPYYDGGWYYGTNGWFWVSAEPWGWAPYHYGRWNWMAGYGWCWFPGQVFGGAWVSWSWGSAYFGWCPLGYWGYPAYYGSLWYDYYDPWCWTFVDYHHPVGHDVPRYAVPVERVRGDLPRHAVGTRAPLVSPKKLRDSAEWRERAVRQTAEERGGRMGPGRKDATPRTKFTDIEDRIVRRGPKVVPAAPGKPDGSSRVRPSPAPVAPRGPAAAERGRQAERGRDATRPGPNNREIGPRAPAAEPASPAKETVRFPRRIAEDPRRSRERATAPAPRPPSGAERGRPAGDDRVKERVRDLYDHQSRPRQATPEVRSSPAPERRQVHEQPRSAPSRPQAGAQRPSSAPRGGPPTQQAPRAQPKQGGKRR